MNRSTRIAVGLLAPSITAILILVLIYPWVHTMDTIDPATVLLMLGFILSSVGSSVFTGYFFKDLMFRNKADVWLLYLNALPWLAFVALFFDRYWVLLFPLLFTPVLGYWFAKRFFDNSQQPQRRW